MIKTVFYNAHGAGGTFENSNAAEDMCLENEEFRWALKVFTASSNSIHGAIYH